MEDFDAVLTVGVDSPGLPGDLLERLSPAPAFVAGQPVIALWPVSAATAVETSSRSIHGLSITGHGRSSYNFV